MVSHQSDSNIGGENSSLLDSFPTSDDEINDSLWSLLTDTNFDISAIGEEQEPEPEPPTHPSPEESDVEEDLPEPVFDVTQNKGGKKKISLIIGCQVKGKKKWKFHILVNFKLRRDFLSLLVPASKITMCF